MKLFRRKRNQENEPVEAPKIPSLCEVFGHTWKDFPAYINTSWYGREYENVIKVVEPYVCVCCKQRKNVILEQNILSDINKRDFYECRDRIREKFHPLVRSQIEVEDMINDTIYVDREKLDAWERLHGKGKKEEFKLVLPKGTN